MRLLDGTAQWDYSLGRPKSKLLRECNEVLQNGHRSSETFLCNFYDSYQLWQNDAYPNSFNYKSSSTILRLGLCFPAAKAEALGPGVR